MLDKMVQEPLHYTDNSFYVGSDYFTGVRLLKLLNHNMVTGRFSITGLSLSFWTRGRKQCGGVVVNDGACMLEVSTSNLTIV